MPLVLLARCPEPCAVPQAVGQRGLAQRVSSFADQIRDRGIDASFGLELRSAFLLEHETPLDAVDRPPYRQFLLRPAIEPILYSYVSALSIGGLDTGTIDDFLSCLHGLPVERRRNPSRITPNAHGNWVQFPDWEYAADFHLRLNRNLPTIDDAITRAAYAYAEVLLSHPYGDGNGRLARALAVICLGDGRPSSTPFLPLGPAFYAHAPVIASALQALSATGDWVPFQHVFADFVSQGLTLAERVFEKDRMADRI